MKKIGLALGGGSARGVAHIGVIKALEEAKIPIHCIAGTSAGAIAGGVYVGGNLDEFAEELKTMTWQRTLKYFDLGLFRNGLFNGQKIYQFIDSFLTRKTFSNLPTKFAAVSADIKTGKEMVIQKGKIMEGIRASMALPGIFTPVKKQDFYLADGGLTNPVPINIAYTMGADIVIGVDLNHHFSTDKKKLKNKKAETPKTFLEQIKSKYQNSSWRMRRMMNKWLKSDQPGLFEILNSSINIMQNEITQKNLIKNPPDILLQLKLGRIGLFDFHQAEWMIEEGYKEMKKQIPKLKKMMG